jgi:hypothetical protein
LFASLLFLKKISGCIEVSFFVIVTNNFEEKKLLHNQGGEVFFEIEFIFFLLRTQNLNFWISMKTKRANSPLYNYYFFQKLSVLDENKKFIFIKN